MMGDHVCSAVDAEGKLDIGLEARTAVTLVCSRDAFSSAVTTHQTPYL